MDISGTDIRKIAENIDLEPQSITEIDDGSDKLYLIEEAGNDLVIKFRDLEQLELSWFKKEPLMINKMSDDTTIPVPNIVHYNMYGEDYPPFFIMDFIEGKTLAKVAEDAGQNLIKRLHFQAGMYLGQIHSETSFDAPGRLVYRNDNLELEEDSWKNIFESMALERLSNLRETEFNKYADEVETYLNENMDSISIVENFVLCHDDYRPGNIMARNGEIVAVIDWARAFSGDPLYDLINSGYHFDNDEKEQIPNKEFQRGYNESYKSVPDEKRKNLYLLNSIIGQMIGFSTIWGSSYSTEEQKEIRSKLSKDLENIIR